MFPPKTHHDITVEIVSRELVVLSVEADKYSCKKYLFPAHTNKTPERVGEDDFFHQINIA